MTWPVDRCPEYLTTLRDQVTDVESWTKWGGAEARFHYPICNVSGERGTPDPLPAILVNRCPTKRSSAGEGSAGAISGTFELIFYFSTVTHPTAAEVEATVQDIIYELLRQQVGHLFGDPEIGDASDPTPAAGAGDTATNSFRSVTVHLPWGAQA